MQEEIKPKLSGTPGPTTVIKSEDYFLSGLIEGENTIFYVSRENLLTCSPSHFHGGAATRGSSDKLPLMDYSSPPKSYSFAVYFTLATVRASFNSFAFAPASSIVENSTIWPSFLSHVKPEPSSRAGDLSHKILYIKTLLIELYLNLIAFGKRAEMSLNDDKT